MSGTPTMIVTPYGPSQVTEVGTIGGRGFTGATGPVGPSNNALNGLVNVCDPLYGAKGDFIADDGLAIQAAVDDCYGPSSNPHGSALVYTNRKLFFPPGRYKITSPINFRSVYAGVVEGCGRFNTEIINVANGNIFQTNGFQYSDIKGIKFTTGGDGVGIDLDWDGSGPAALQSNKILDCYFQSGAFGVRVGNSNHMGSEGLLMNCAFDHQTVAGFATMNYNALQWGIYGGNFQSCELALYVLAGSIPFVCGVGFQANVWDVHISNGAWDAMSLIGCRSESLNFVYARAQAINMYGCTQSNASPGTLLDSNFPIDVAGMTSVAGQIVMKNPSAVGTVRSSQFGRDDWATCENGARINTEMTRVGQTWLNTGTGTPRLLIKGHVFGPTPGNKNSAFSADQPENATYNNILYPNDFNAPPWFNPNFGIAVPGILAPDGSNNASTIFTGVGTHLDYVQISHVVNADGSVTILCEIQAKQGTVPWLGMGFDDRAINDGAFFNLAAGTIGTVAAGCTPTIASLGGAGGGGWYLCRASRTYSVAQVHYMSIEIHTADNQNAYNATGTQSLLVFNATSTKT